MYTQGVPQAGKVHTVDGGREEIYTLDFDAAEVHTPDAGHADVHTPDVATTEHASLTQNVVFGSARP